jgi:uncharacterized protein YndB with AHSA1/START domain
VEIIVFRSLLIPYNEGQMSQTREHVASVVLPASPEAVFVSLVTPSAIRQWWGASRVIVHPRPGGLWAAAWGEDEDSPEYMTIARLGVYEPPVRLRLVEIDYVAKREGAPPFEAKIETEFQIDPATEKGSKLTVVQSGFPMDEEADSFYMSCKTGWHTTLAQLLAYHRSLAKADAPVRV